MQEVAGSIPVVSTKKPLKQRFFLFSQNCEKSIMIYKLCVRLCVELSAELGHFGDKFVSVLVDVNIRCGRVVGVSDNLL